MRNANPVLNKLNGIQAFDNQNIATKKGILIKTFISILIGSIVAALTYAYLPKIIEAGNSNAMYIFIVVSSIIGSIITFIAMANPKMAKYATIIYSMCEGVFVGSLVYIADYFASGVFPYVGIMAAIITLCIFIGVAVVSFTGIIKNTSKVVTFTSALGIAVFLVFIAYMIMFIFNIGIFSSSISLQNYLIFMIAFTALLLLYGVFMLFLNFEQAKSIVENRLPKEYEWFAVLGLVITILYIYVQVVRLLMYLAIFSQNND